MKAQLFAFALFSFSLVLSAHADNVYKWQSSDGVTHFSSKAPSKDAKPAELPKITRGEVKLAKSSLVSCDSHGGIDCQTGADTDGSVVCTDGFKGASARFRFSCSTPKLEVTDISELNANGSFSVFVRNSKSVPAEKPSVKFKPEIGEALALIGPPTIDAYGMAEFTLQPKAGAQKLALSAKPATHQIDVTCNNCP